MGTSQGQEGRKDIESGGGCEIGEGNDGEEDSMKEEWAERSENV